MTPAWHRDLFRIHEMHFRGWVAARVAIAVGLPIAIGMAAERTDVGVLAGFCAMLTTFCDVGDTHRERLTTMTCGVTAIVVGGVVGAQLGGLAHANEALVVLAAIVVGALSGTRPGVAAIARFFAIAVVAGGGMQLPDDAIVATAGGGLCAVLVPAAIWWIWPNVRPGALMEWQKTIAKTFAFDRPDPRFALAITLAASTALFAADALHISRPYWAAISVLMVMRREGTESLRLTWHYAAGTILGLLLAAALTQMLPYVPLLAAVAVAVAAITRLALAVNPSLGFTGFTLFLLLLIDAAAPQHGFSLALWSTRLYDVVVGCALSIVGTLLASHLARR